MRLAVLLTALLAAFAAITAVAHEPPDRRVRIVADAPRVDGIEVSVFRDVPAAPPSMTVRNGTGQDLEILGEGGEPFLRIGPRGVSGNVRSLTYHHALDPFGTRPPPPDARPGAPPRWRTLTEVSPEWRWFERRIDLHLAVPQEALRERRTVVLSTWEIPARYGGAPMPLTGRVVFKPPTGRVEARIQQVTPAVPGLEVGIGQGRIPAIQVRNSSGKRLQVVGRDGRVLGAVGPGGVDVNVNSAAYRDTKGLPEAPTAEPSFTHTQDTPILVWLERRAAYLSLDDPPEGVGDENDRGERVLVRWTVSGDYDGAPWTLTGITWWLPLARTSQGRPFPLWPVLGSAGAGLTGIAVGVAMTVRNRRRR